MDDKTETVLTESYVETPEHPITGPSWKVLPEVLRYYSDKYPDAECMIFYAADGTRSAITFSDVYENAQRVAYNLITLGVKPKETVAINLRTSPEWLYTAFGAMIAGAVPFGISFTYADGSDLIAMMERLQTCSCLVMGPGLDGKNWSILSNLVESHGPDGSVTSEKMPYLRYLIGHDVQMKTMTNVKPLTDLLADHDHPDKPELPQLRCDDIAGLFQTSGSTGTPKIIAHTHSSMLAPTRLDPRAMERKPGDIKYFLERPFDWIGGYPFTLLTGSVRVTCSDLDSISDPADKAKFLCDVISKENCHLIFVPFKILPAIAAMENIEKDWAARTLMFGSSPISRRMLTMVDKKCLQVLVAYGGSETLTVSFTVVTDVNTFTDFTSGRITPGNSVKIVDEKGEIVAPNTRGEIYVKSKGLFREYYNDPEKTAAVFTEDGWYKTDDVGRFLEDGTLMVEGRKSNMIISGGMNVAPEILEAAIEKCPGVETAVVVPVSDDVMYQEICACVKVVSGSGLDEDGVRKFCEEAHSDKKQAFTVLPKYYLIVDSFPETMTGKVVRKTLSSIAERAVKKDVE